MREKHTILPLPAWTVLSIREKQRSFLDINTPERILHGMLEMGAECSAGSALGAVFRSTMGVMPNPVAMPVNGALRAQEQGFGWGQSGGHQMSKNRVRIRSRQLMELLAGRRTVAELNEMHRWRSVDAPPSNETMFNPFDRSLNDGRLPAEIKVVKTGEDDWIEFEFGDVDASISRIR